MRSLDTVLVSVVKKLIKSIQNVPRSWFVCVLLITDIY
jgi:hypothetical protein